MTDREKVVVMAYTGVCTLAGDKLSLFYRYVQDKLGHCVMTHELAYPEVQDAIKKASRDDFIELCKSSDEPRVMTLEEAVAADYVYLDIKIHDRIVCCILAPEPDGEYIQVRTRGFGGCLEPETYGADWRCWTARPTDEEREAEPWEK